MITKIAHFTPTIQRTQHTQHTLTYASRRKTNREGPQENTNTEFELSIPNNNRILTPPIELNSCNNPKEVTH